MPEPYSMRLALEIRFDLCNLLGDLSTKPTVVPDLLFRPQQ
jgi:hypothetical protein